MDSSIKKENLYLEQIQRLSEHTIFGISATLINSLILSLILWNVAPKMSVMIWFFLLISVSLVRLFLQRTYSKAMPEFEKAKKWKNWFLLTIAFSGVIWGSAGIFLFPPDSIGHQTFIAFVLGGMVAGSVGLFSVVLTAFLAYSIPALLPIVIMFLLVNDEIHIAMGIMGILFWLIMFLTAKGLNKTIATSLSLKYENVALISELQDEIEERRKIEKELLKEHEEIEGIVEERTSELRDVNKKLVEEIEVRKNAENAFREGETRLRALINHAPVVLWAIDNGGVFTFSEGKGLEAVNLGPGEVIGRSLFEMYGDNEQIVDDARQVLSGNTVSSTTKVDGIIFENRYVPIFDEKDSVIGAIGVSIDVTERKRTENALRESEEKYSNLFHFSNDGIFVHDLEGNILDVNQKALDQLGYTKSEMLSFKIPDFHPPEVLEKSQWAFETIIREGFASFETNFKKKTGEVFPAEVSSSLYEIGDKKVIQGIIRDITKRKQAEKVLRQSEERLSLAGETGNLGMWGWRIDLGRIFANEKFYEITGLSEEETRNFSLKLWLRKFHPDDRKRTLEMLQSLFKGEIKRMENEFRFRHPEKGWIWLYGVSRVVERDKDGKPIRMVGVHQDITDRKQAEEDREKIINELYDALKEIKKLRGILPFCSFCKKIRDDKGYWEQVDVYIQKYSEADISHSICPDCMKKHYPEAYEDMYPTEE